MAKEKILITVKTYPTLSMKYTELACTAGVREDGSWIRLYPIPYRLLDSEQKFIKYQWIEADIDRNPGDQRPESFRISNIDNIRLLEKIGTKREWEDRRRQVLTPNKIYTSMQELIDLAHSNTLSLAVFKPTEILDFTIEAADEEWPEDKKSGVLARLKQGNLFEGQDAEEFKLVSKLPYKFSYRFRDEARKTSKLMIEDWEIGQLYWNCLKRYGETRALPKVREKYLDDFAKTKDLHLFLGTTYESHVRKFTNPWIIIGTFYPPHRMQDSLF